MGLHASPTCEVQYSHTPAVLIGKRRFGLMRYAMAMMNGARLAVAAQAIGIAEAAYREAFRYASERIQFNQPIRLLPAVSRMLISMRGEIEAARALTFETAVWVDRLKAYDQLQEAGDKSSLIYGGRAHPLTVITPRWKTGLLPGDADPWRRGRASSMSSAITVMSAD
jgi:alkylation response protein AidB-like acyl-CoA dehydrogenase